MILCFGASTEVRIDQRRIDSRTEPHISADVIRLLVDELVPIGTNLVVRPRRPEVVWLLRTSSGSNRT